MEMVDYHHRHTLPKRKIQTTLDGNISGGDNDSHYADKLQLPKPARVLRVFGGYPCNLPVYAIMDKSKQFIHTIKTLEADVGMITEHDPFIPNLDENDHLQTSASTVL